MSGGSRSQVTRNTGHRRREISGRNMIPGAVANVRQSRGKLSSEPFSSISRRPVRVSHMEREIYHYQHNVDTLIQKLPFARLVQELVEQIAQRDGSKGPYRFQGMAMEALQSATEEYIVELFSTALLATYHANRVTLMSKDILLVLRIQQRNLNSLR
ncbi:Histone H3 [Giardia lamblia P15]|uniref:Histone H3 n=1 Tax=Giardia intestinalis (strain P15) TaxID=658858 RepID=E1F5K5_GIAIA|nr:Histone H3 [Giardia lamblia P15]